MDVTVLTDSAEVAALCRRLGQSEFITVDTEFRRQTTYWPELCLIQVAGEDEAVVIDPLAPGMALQPFYDLLANEDVLKVFHAARQDIEIFYHEAGVIPAPLFDTQVAAMVCGFGESVGYETLVNKLAKAQLDKATRFTDWMHRPLSQKQLAYALSDVTHLRTIYAILRDRLAKNERYPWLEEELNTLTDPATYDIAPEDAWKRLKTRSTSRRFLGILQEVAAWRERLAQNRNVPRNRIARDDVVTQIAAQAPTNRADLAKIRQMPKNFADSKDGQLLLEAVKRGKEMPAEDLPKAKTPGAKAKVNPSLVDLLRVLLKMKSEEHGVAQKLIASGDDLERLAAGEHDDLPAVHGWRHAVFGRDAVKLLAGDVALSVAGDKAVLRETG